MKTLPVILLASAICLFSTVETTWAQPGFRERPQGEAQQGGGFFNRRFGNRGGGQMGDRAAFLRSLNLSPEQAEKLKEFRTNRDKTKKMALKFALAKMELSDKIKNLESSEDEIWDEAKKLVDLVEEMTKLRVENMLLLRRTLNEEQLEKVLERVSEFTAQRGGGMQGFGGQ